MTNHFMGRLRRVALCAIPAVLLIALAWSTLPHGPRERVPSRLSAAAGGGNQGPRAASTGPAGADPASSASRGAGSAAAAAPTTAAPSAGRIERPRTEVSSGEVKLGDLVGTDGRGHMRWQIKADDMVLAQAQQTVVLKRVRATFFDDDGTRMFVNGDSGAYDTRTRAITVGGDVHGRTSTGRELFADTVHYSPQTRQVEGTGHVRVVQERVIMYADRMVSDLTLGQTRFFGHVHMTLR